MSVQCFLIEETDQLERYLRRYHDECEAPYRWLNGMNLIDIIEWPKNTIISLEAKGQQVFPHEDSRWPIVCDCGHAFTDADHWQVFVERIYRRVDTSETMTLRTAPPGAMWNGWWLAEHGRWVGPDGMSLHVRCPDGHDWCIDARASNCTMKDDHVHKCWVRHGEPPNITVDKNGHTCAAGAGSIQTPKWHGFLRGGFLVEC